jgi:hypothetical protein
LQVLPTEFTSQVLWSTFGSLKEDRTRTPWETQTPLSFWVTSEISSFLQKAFQVDSRGWVSARTEAEWGGDNSEDELHLKLELSLPLISMIAK